MNTSIQDTQRHLREGLPNDEAVRRLAQDGANEIEADQPRTWLRLGIEILKEPMFVLLLAAAGIYLLLGDLHESLILAASIAVIAAITLLQERRTETALARLRDLSSPRALVIRDSVKRRVPGRDVVVGDVVLLAEGDRVPADLVIHSASNLTVDESILTGESLPVEKQAATAQSADSGTRAHSGTLVVRGHGIGIAIATGHRTEIGKIGRALHTLEPQTTPLFREIRSVVRWVAAGALALCAFIGTTYALTRGDPLGGVLAGITVAMGVLPEEFPVVLTLFLVMGAWRISRVGVLTRRMPSVEAIGSVTVLCVDKTGTLTENRMRVALIESPLHRADLRLGAPAMDADVVELVRVASAASKPDAFDPMEQAINECWRTLGTALEPLPGSTFVRGYELTPQLPVVAHVWQAAGSASFRVALKGAPETVLQLCRIDGSRRARLLDRIAHHAEDGLRVLAVARAEHAGPLPNDPQGFELEFLGLLALADPLRADVPGALATCHGAGIRVVMITGDHPGTARSIARQAGFDVSGGVLTGSELEMLSDSKLQPRVRTVSVFARMTPQQKLRLVQALQANGEIAAMTGDGVNDAPALKAADIGVAMGARGTDVAREAASIVLVKDDFASLVSAVRVGRRIYDNIRHAMTFIVAVHIPIAGMGLLPVLLDWPLLFFPLHILFLEFVIDPACAFVFEADPEAADIMRRPPRPPDARLFDVRTLAHAVTLGCIALLVCLAVYASSLARMETELARTLAFVSLIAADLALIFVSRSRHQSFRDLVRRPNRVFWWIVALALAALALAISHPALASLFQFAIPPLPLAVGVAVLAASVVFGGGLLLRARRPADAG